MDCLVIQLLYRYMVHVSQVYLKKKKKHLFNSVFPPPSVIAQQLLCAVSPTLESIQRRDAYLQPIGCQLSAESAV